MAQLTKHMILARLQWRLKTSNVLPEGGLKVANFKLEHFVFLWKFLQRRLSKRFWFVGQICLGEISLIIEGPPR